MEGDPKKVHIPHTHRHLSPSVCQIRCNSLPCSSWSSFCCSRIWNSSFGNSLQCVAVVSRNSSSNRKQLSWSIDLLIAFPASSWTWRVAALTVERIKLWCPSFLGVCCEVVVCFLISCWWRLKLAAFCATRCFFCSPQCTTFWITVCRSLPQSGCWSFSLSRDLKSERLNPWHARLCPSSSLKMSTRLHGECFPPSVHGTCSRRHHASWWNALQESFWTLMQWSAPRFKSPRAGELLASSKLLDFCSALWNVMLSRPHGRARMHRMSALEFATTTMHS